jgi:hypothetical protein
MKLYAEETAIRPVIHDPQPTREARKEFGLMHPNNVGQGINGEDRWILVRVWYLTIYL